MSQGGVGRARLRGRVWGVQHQAGSAAGELDRSFRARKGRKGVRVREVQGRRV